MTSSDSTQLPDGIGPHNGREYELMATAKKCVALFFDLIPDEFHENPAKLSMGRISSEDGTCSVYYLDGHREEAFRLLDLSLGTSYAGYVPEVEREIGQLLGYEEWQIDAFLAHVGAT